MTGPQGLKAEGLTFRVGDVSIVDAIGLEVEAGRTVGIVGPNGSGKSTFVRMLYRALAPDHGSVWIGKDDLLAMPAGDAASRLAAVPQEPVADNGLRVIDLAMVGRIPYRRGFGGETAADRAIVAEALASVGLDGMATRLVRTLSGGERQRALIARALAQDTSVIVLDEPTNHLDLRYQHDLLGLLRDLPVTVIVVLHDINLALEYCDEVVVLEQGAVHAAGPASEVLSPQVLAEVFGVHAHSVVHPVTGRRHLLISAQGAITAEPAALNLVSQKDSSHEVRPHHSLADAGRQRVR